MNTNVVLIILCGCPCTGKTYFISRFNKYLEKQTKIDFNLIQLSFDDIINTNLEKNLIEIEYWKKSRNFLHDLIGKLIDYLKQDTVNYVDFNDYLNETKQISSFNDQIESLLNEIKTNFLRKISFNSKKLHLIAIDDNMYYESMRYKYYQLAKDKLCSYYCVCLKVNDLNNLLELNHKRNEQYNNTESALSDTIIENMFIKFNYPDQINWEKPHSIIIDYNYDLFNEIDFNQLYSNLLTKINELFLKFNLFNASIACEKSDYIDKNLNIRHQSDLVLRRLIKQEIEKTDVNTKQELAIKLNKTKTVLLQQLADKTDGLYTHLDYLFKHNLIIYENYLKNYFLNSLS